MKKRLPLCDELSPVPTCENCAYTIRNKWRPDMPVCIPHLKTIPANNSMPCELHSMKNRKISRQ